MYIGWNYRTYITIAPNTSAQTISAPTVKKPFPS